MKIMTLEELAAHDGQNGHRALIAFQGKVYDVTDSFLWQNGNHQVLHQAGRDLTNEMKDAPHGEDLLTKFPVVAQLARAK
ncbi:MAG: cytochrome B5 [Calditrichaeota bacterium]|nr:cytochrome B5 [Calditrichota bacterium]